MWKSFENVGLQTSEKVSWEKRNKLECWQLTCQFPTCRSPVLCSLTIEKVKNVEVHQYAKFRRNRLNYGRDMVIFLFFKMAAAAILDF